MRLILLGPPGAGKGTQAKLLSQQFNIPHISTGDILRDEVRENSQLGRRVAEFVKIGELVPDDIAVEVVMHRLAKSDAAGGFILDGFPRTFKQAEELNKALRQLNISIDLIIYFETSLEVSIRRLSGRRVCKGCGANFHLTNMPPKREGICDFCGGELFLRDDDKEETVKKRLAIYQKQTAGLIDYYKKSGVLRKVSGDSEANRLNARLLKMFARQNPAVLPK
ncbi:MAG: adenylate kinase [Candidatus Omnitrophica bacterium]|nr:adenylate kinase [Candidatus Omnitrophota bacterium]MBU4140864.1 adenylate kinase [Candidatus Omnitrophota bacterium]